MENERFLKGTAIGFLDNFPKEITMGQLPSRSTAHWTFISLDNCPYGPMIFDGRKILKNRILYVLS